MFLAKNKNGYHNLAKLASKAYTDGFYYVPRIDRALVETYKEDLMVLTGGLFGEVPSLILNVGEAQAEEAFLFWKTMMGDDFYAELNRHGLEEETGGQRRAARFGFHARRQVGGEQQQLLHPPRPKRRPRHPAVRQGRPQRQPAQAVRGQARAGIQVWLPQRLASI